MQHHPTNQPHHRDLHQHPDFHSLVKERNSFAIKMTLISASVYYCFILLVAFNKAWLATKLGEGMTTSIGVPIGVGVIVFTVILTWIYVRRCNDEFDEKNQRLIEGNHHEKN
jgi:uncharacterized membrane protein (DUF485 family)